MKKDRMLKYITSVPTDIHEHLLGMDVALPFQYSNPNYNVKLGH